MTDLERLKAELTCVRAEARRYERVAYLVQEHGARLNEAEVALLEALWHLQTPRAIEALCGLLERAPDVDPAVATILRTSVAPAIRAYLHAEHEEVDVDFRNGWARRNYDPD